MPRYIRNTVILAKIEATYGTDASPTGTDALLVSNVSITRNLNSVNRDLIRGYMGASEQLVGTRSIQCEFTVELAGSGTAGTAAAYGKLLRACGMAETVNASPPYVEYNPVSTNFSSITIYYYLDGLVHKALGCRGTVDVRLPLGERPVLQFRFTGLDGGSVVQSNPTPTLTAWKTPVVVTDANTGDITLGGTYASGAISGGTTYSSRGIEITIGQAVQFIPMLGGEQVDITGREVTGRMTLDLTASQEATMVTDITNNTLTSIGITHGAASGNTIVLFAPAVQRTNPRIEDVEGRALLSMDLRFTPSTGNDEVRIVTK
jgi:hypothetical protein